MIKIDRAVKYSISTIRYVKLLAIMGQKKSVRDNVVWDSVSVVYEIVEHVCFPFHLSNRIEAEIVGFRLSECFPSSIGIVLTYASTFVSSFEKTRSSLHVNCCVSL